ncbi:MAG: hypothetical protein JSV65_10375 [Armatimonadota bacterium]|nr:MAG: hypothetical protein JSV65_10375 [Armatimonadota bacterium]
MIHAVIALAVSLSPAAASPAEPVRSLTVKGRLVAVNDRPTFLVGQMSHHAAMGRSLDEIAEIVDVMMLPYGMNLWVGDFGAIDFGAWNEVVNVRRDLEQGTRQHEYPWMRTGPGETVFGGPRFDLDRFDESYFKTLRARLKFLNEKGIVPVVGIFTEHAIDHPLHWRGHPFHPENNVNELGLPGDKAIPEFFENRRALEYQEAYVRRLLGTLSDVAYILSPFGEAKRAPSGYINRWLRLCEEHKRRSGASPLVCLSGSSEVLDRFAADPAVDLIDVYCYHGGRYDDPEVNVPEGDLGIRATLREAWRKYHKPVGKLYHKYGYPYEHPGSRWADPDTGTDGGGPPTAARDALGAVHEAGGFGCFFKMAWQRDRGRYLKPDLWSSYILEFREALTREEPSVQRHLRE